MRAAIIALTTIVALFTSVLAQSRKVLVLPLDGNTPAALRQKLSAMIVKLAKAKSSGSVTVGDTTFEETAAAVGCNPSDAACAETVRKTLGVDELVYGTATTEDGATTIMVHRATAGGDPKTQISVIAEGDDASAAEESLGPLFGDDRSVHEENGSDTSGSGSGSGSDEAGRPRPAHSTFFSTTERKLAVAFAAGGVISLVLGFSLWSSAGGLQDEIDAHPDRTLAEINDLRALEDRAASKALWGNIFVVVGLAATGVGGYFFWKDRQKRQAAIAPVPAETGTGMTLVLGGRW
jgi:hypothetical protein